jgi:uncharacterized membrane protein
MSAFLAIGDARGVSVIVPLLAFAAALAVIGLIRRILISAYDSLQLNSVIDKVFKTGRSIIVDLYPNPVGATGTESHPAPTSTGHRVRWTSSQATLEQIDLRRLVTEAERADSVVCFHVRVGAIIREGSTIATVQGDLTGDIVKSSCVVGANRTFNQDPLLAFRLLADIGLRALSPAVNDPATAVQAFDAVVGLLRLLASRDLAIGAITSPTGEVRVQLEMPAWSDFVSEGLDDLLAVAGTSPMMVQRVTATLHELAGETPQSRRSEVEARLPSMTGTTNC